MASIKLISEDEATGKVKEVYEDIKSRLGISIICCNATTTNIAPCCEGKSIILVMTKRLDEVIL